MLRLISYILLITVLSLGISWLFENNALISFEWRNYRVQTDLGIVSLYLALGLILTIAVTRIATWARAVPNNIVEDIASKRKIKGYNYLVNAFVSLMEENVKKSEALVKQSIKLLGEEPNAMLLSAEIEKRKGNLDESNKYLANIVKSSELEDIARHRIVNNLESSGKYQKAIDIAEKTNGGWVDDSLLSLYKKNHNWKEALETINKKIGFFGNAVDKQKLKSEQAIIYLIMAENYYSQAKIKEAYNYAEKAYFILPDFVPAIAIYANSALSLSKHGRAESIIERAWAKSADQKLGEVYTRAISNLKLNKQLKKYSELYNLNPDNVFSKLSFARFLFDNGFADQAKQVLENGADAANNSAIFKMLAKIEESLGTSRERINTLVKKAEYAEQDDVWGCAECGTVSEDWHGVCPSCKSFDSFKSQKSNIKVLSSAEKIEVTELRRPANNN